MDKIEFLKKCNFRKEWLEWKMLTGPIVDKLYQLYRSEGKDRDWEGFRLEAFSHWLDGDLTEDQMSKLFRLASYELSGEYLRSSINRHKNCTEPLRKTLFGYTKKEIPRFSKQRLSELLHFPKEWLEWDMYPEELYLEHRKRFQPGDEAGSENDRNAAFHYWLSRELGEDQLLKLAKLTFLDPDSVMARDVRKHIGNHKNCTECVMQLLDQG